MATPEDAAAVGALLHASCPALLRDSYDPDLLAAVLPIMVRANPQLLRSGTCHLAEADGADIVASGDGRSQWPPASSCPAS